MFAFLFSDSTIMFQRPGPRGCARGGAPRRPAASTYRAGRTRARRAGAARSRDRSPPTSRPYFATFCEGQTRSVVIKEDMQLHAITINCKIHAVFGQTIYFSDKRASDAFPLQIFSELIGNQKITKFYGHPGS